MRHDASRVGAAPRNSSAEANSLVSYPHNESISSRERRMSRSSSMTTITFCSAKKVPRMDIESYSWRLNSPICYHPVLTSLRQCLAFPRQWFASSRQHVRSAIAMTTTIRCNRCDEIGVGLPSHDDRPWESGLPFWPGSGDANDPQRTSPLP
jgi:hypothetical protein